MSSARTLGAVTAVGAAVVVALAIGLVVDAGPAAIIGAAVVGSLAALLVEWFVERGSSVPSAEPAGAERASGAPAPTPAERPAGRPEPAEATARVLGGSGWPAVGGDRTEPLAPVAPIAPVDPGAAERRDPRPATDGPVDLDGWRSGSWRRGGQCPACGGWADAIVEDGAWYRFTCARCGHRWRWQPGYAWPATLIRPDVGRDLAPTRRSGATEEAEGA